MPDKMHLLMVLHSHQPVGNFEQVFALATEKCYRPVMEILHQYPEFRLALHFSGPLLLWLEKGDPELLQMIGQMRARGQVELLGGAFYEPLLAAIPRRDALAQLKMQNQFQQKCFQVKPEGFWLAERIWEPGLPELVSQAGLKYTIVDDTHLYYAGLNEHDMFGYQLTEREGKPLALFPTNKELRYTIPFQLPAKTIEFLRASFEQHGPTSATYGDDCEKFGLWPRTYEHVIEGGWLQDFIETVLAEDKWLQASQPGYFLNTHPPRGRIYLPTSSYEEMLMWALPWQVARQMEELVHELKQENRYEQMKRFLRGGLWENFLVKYRESNLMHKKMLYVSQLLADNPLPQAYDHLLQAQCNCSYWHGLFGGLYLSHIRHAVHANLIAAQSLLDERDFSQFARAMVQDIDLDGSQEVLLSSSVLDCQVHPAYGGSISLLNLRQARFNLADTLTRRPEAYHNLFEQNPTVMDDESGYSGEEAFSPHDKIVVKEEGLQEILFYDWYERAVFQDHVLPFASQLAPFSQARHIEWGDFVDQPYALLKSGNSDGRASCHMQRAGKVWSPCGPWPLTVDKTFTLAQDGRLTCDYQLQSQELAMPVFTWAVELNLTLLSDLDPGRYIMAGGQRVEFSDTFVAEDKLCSFSLINQPENFRVDVSLSQPAWLWSWPVFTVSQSEAGLERTYQGTSLVVLWDVAGGKFNTEYSISLKV